MPNCLCTGVTGEVNQQAAREHFERAAGGGHIPAQNGLGALKRIHGLHTCRHTIRSGAFDYATVDHCNGPLLNY